MSLASHAYTAVVFSGGMIALLLALGQTIIRKRNRGNRLLFYIYGTLALIQFHVLLFVGTRPFLPSVWPLGASLRLALGPLLMLFMTDILFRRPIRRPWLHFLPALMAGVSVPPLVAWDLGLMGQAAPAWLAHGEIAFTIVNVGANILLLVYIAPLGFFLMRRRADLISGPVILRIIAGVLALVMLTIPFMLVNLTMRPAPLVGIGPVMLSCVIYLVFVLGYVYPEVLHVMRIEAFEQSRSASPLRNLDPDELNERLDAVMRAERPHQDEDLQLADMARALRLSPKQLTYYLNHVRGTSFSAFIHAYRIQDACRMLVDEPERSVTSIGYAVGFNSKSAFYRAFQSIQGATPRAYREAARGRGKKS